MKTKLISFVFLLTFLFVAPHKAAAAELSSGSSAIFASTITAQSSDTRGLALRAYFTKQNSPLASYADVFVAMADRYGLPWHLVAAISCTESSCGLQAPYNCNNFYGFGIYGDNVLCFKSIPEGIETVSEALRDKYINQWGATDVYGIGRLYAASPAWAGHTLYFMKQIEAFKLSFDASALPISF